MKTTLWVLLFLCASALCAEVLFYDNFNRANGAVGNSWTNIGSATNTIENNALKIVSPNGTGIKHDFTPLSSGVVYIQYDWKVVSTGWYADAFPTGLITHLVMDWDGNLFYDLDGTMINQVALQQIGLGSYATIRLKIDLDADLFSVWINNILAAENIAGNAVSSFSSFTFRGLGASTVQYVDNFLLFNSVAPGGFTATGNLNDIALSWNASSYPEAQSYKIYRDTASPAVTLLTELPGTASNYTDNSAQPNTDYFYRIKAIQAGSVETDFSPELMAHLQPQISVTPQNITFNVGYGYSDSTYVTISNSGNYPLEWNIQGTSEIPTDGLIAFFPFNGNANDESGNGHNGTVNEATLTTDRSGNENSAYLFDGPDDYIQASSTGFPFGNSPRTIAFWVYYNQYPSSTGNNLVWYGQLGSYNGVYELYTYRPEDGFRLWFSQWGQNVNGSTTFELNRWYFCTIASTGNNVKLYLDGALDGAGVNTINTVVGPNLFQIGDQNYEHIRNLNGKIDDVMVYNRELSADEIMSLYLSSLPSHLSISPSRGTIEQANNQSLKIKVNANLLEVGTHIDTLFVESNDPENPVIPIVITTNVLPPIPTISPDPLIVNLNVDNHNREALFQIHNQGQGKLLYGLKGTDEYGDPNQITDIPGFVSMGMYNDHTYYRSIEKMSWYNARDLCEQQGGHLATVANADENLFIYNNTIDCSWLGLTDEGSENVWRWITDEPVTYLVWAPYNGEPNGGLEENYAHMRWTFYNELWNDAPGDAIDVYSHAVLEIDNPYSSFLTFAPWFGAVDCSSAAAISLTVDGENLTDGVYPSSIRVSADGVSEPWYFPVTVNVDYTPPLAISGLAIDDAATNDDQIGINWFSNSIADSVVAYKIYRRGADETEWQLKATVPSTQLSYVDSDFGDFVDTYQFYRVRAEDWVGNISAVGDSVMEALNRFLSPANMVIQNINNRDIHLSWDPVTETISGTPGTPSCYVIYKSQYPSPINDFDFLSISFTNEFTHQWALHFQPLNRLFYVVTAYGGDMGRMQSLMAQKSEWKYGELEKILKENGIQHRELMK